MITDLPNMHEFLKDSECHPSLYIYILSLFRFFFGLFLCLFVFVYLFVCLLTPISCYTAPVYIKSFSFEFLSSRDGLYYKIKVKREKKLGGKVIFGHI